MIFLKKRNRLKTIIIIENDSKKNNILNRNTCYISGVKNLIKISGIALLSLVYCFSISLASDISQNPGFSVKTTSEKVNKDLSVSIKQFSNTAEAESLVNPFSNSLPTLKDTNNGFSAIVKIRELFFANEFSQYIFTARNFLIKYGKANIIFPFHYFW